MSVKVPGQAGIQAALVRQIGGASDASAIAAATVHTWQQVFGRLSPIIGARGVQVLLRRALHLTGRPYPWLLVNGTEYGEGNALLEELKTRLAEQPKAVAMSASQALLQTFCELLTGLIGESLSERLLTPVWAPPSTGPAQEKT